MTTPATPSRRSKRYQQLVTPVHPSAWGDKSTSWSSESFFLRPSIPQDYEALLADENWKPTSDMQTVFYRSFTRTRSLLPQSFKGKSRPPRSQSSIGEEIFNVGDTVCVSTGTVNYDSVGVIVSMWELRTDGSGSMQTNMFIRVHWFQRPIELPRIRPRREHTEVSRPMSLFCPIPTMFQNEVYFTLDTEAILPPTSIVHHCSVTDQPPKENVTQVASSKGPHLLTFRQTQFCCRFALDSKKGLYYDFFWSHHKVRALSETVEEQISGRSWNVPVESQGQKAIRPHKRSRLKKITEAAESPTRETGNDYEYQEPLEEEELPSTADGDLDSEPDAHNEVLEDDIPKTPSRKRKRTISTSSKSTPRKSRLNKAVAPTPHSKAAIRKRNNRKGAVVRVPPPDLTREYYKRLQKLPQDAWLRAMHVLHVAARPDILPCRGEEYNRVLRTVEELLEEGSGGCVCEYFNVCTGVSHCWLSDISGVPGTGKTATVHAVVRELKRMAENGARPRPL